MAVKKCTCKPILKLIVLSNTMFCVHYLSRHRYNAFPAILIIAECVNISRESASATIKLDLYRPNLCIKVRMYLATNKTACLQTNVRLLIHFTQV